MKKYIVMATSATPGEGKEFYHLIDCNEYTIIEYIENLTFKSSLLLHFFDLEVLSDQYLSIASATETISMDSTKSLQDFRNEVQNAIEILHISDTETKD